MTGSFFFIKRAFALAGGLYLPENCTFPENRTQVKKEVTRAGVWCLLLRLMKKNDQRIRLYMLRVGLAIVTFFLLQPLSAQRGFDDQEWNFGDVEFWKNDTARFTVTNATEKELIFLPTYYSEDFWIFFNRRNAAPGESIEIGIVYYTESKGKFHVTVPLYVNLRAEPITFHLRGNIKRFDPSAQLQCPAVNEGREANAVEKLIAIEVRDLQTDELLDPDELNISIRNGKKMRLVRSGLEFKMSAAPGAYRVEAGKQGYHNYLALITLEPYQQRFVVYLEKSDEQLPDPVTEIPEESPVVNRNPESEPDSVELTDLPSEHTHPPDLPPADSSSVDVGGLDHGDYRLNNLIFIVDVSSSMNRGGKFEALKGAFGTLVEALRPEDLVTVISMSSNAAIVQPTTGVVQKDSLRQKVASMKPLGGTNGGAALQMAYTLASEHFIEGGNNQIIIATDGVFYGGTLTRREIEALVEQGNSRGIHLSSVAFGSDPKALLFLGNLSQKGGGSLVQIAGSGESEAQLLEMIKNQSKR